MAYCTPGDVVASQSPTADPTDEETPVGASMPAVQLAIDQATAEIDAKLAYRYTVPFTPVPALIFRIARDKSAWLAMLTQRGGDPVPAGDPTQARKEDADKLLALIVDGSVSPWADDPAQGGGEAAALTGGPFVVNPYAEQLFTTRDVWRPSASDWPFSPPFGGPF